MREAEFAKRQRSWPIMRQSCFLPCRLKVQVFAVTLSSVCGRWPANGGGRAAASKAIATRLAVAEEAVRKTEGLFHAGGQTRMMLARIVRSRSFSGSSPERSGDGGFA